jgi:hypothetical protein
MDINLYMKVLTGITLPLNYFTFTLKKKQYLRVLLGELA